MDRVQHRCHSPFSIVNSQLSVAADVVMQLFDDVFGLARVLALLLDLVAGVHDRGVVALEDLGDIREGIFQQIGRASCRERV